MGDLSKTVVIEVPVEVVYQSMKDFSYRDYIQDLGKMIAFYEIKRDVPNSLLSFSASIWGAKADTDYFLKPFNESSCEITIVFKTKLIGGTNTRALMIYEIQKLKTLEFGYKAGLQKQAKK